LNQVSCIIELNFPPSPITSLLFGVDSSNSILVSEDNEYQMMLTALNQTRVSLYTGGAAPSLDTLSFTTDCRSARSILNSLKDNSAVVKRLSRSLSKPTNETLLYLLENITSLVDSTAGESRSQVIARLTLFYSAFLPLLTAAVKYEASAAVGGNKKSTSTLTFLLAISRVFLDTDVGVLKHKTLLKLALDYKVISWVCGLVIRCQDLTLVQGSDIVPCLVNAFLVTTKFLLSACDPCGADENKELELSLSTAVDLLEPINLSFARLGAIAASDPVSAATNSVRPLLATYAVGVLNHIMRVLSASANLISTLVLGNFANLN